MEEQRAEAAGTRRSGAERLKEQVREARRAEEKAKRRLADAVAWLHAEGCDPEWCGPFSGPCWDEYLKASSEAENCAAEMYLAELRWERAMEEAGAESLPSERSESCDALLLDAG